LVTEFDSAITSGPNTFMDEWWRMVTIIAKDGEKWLVRLDEPVGRFTNADLRVYARQLELDGSVALIDHVARTHSLQ
jgi:hypothetical protein